MLGCAIRLEGGFGKVDEVPGALDIFGRGGPEFPPFVRKPDFDEVAWLDLDKKGIVLVVSGLLGDVVKRLKEGLGVT